MNKIAYPQAKEANEYRYIDPIWLDEVATGLTAGAEKYGEANWKSIPADEHVARAVRHLNQYRVGDRKENHLINASMRCMMAAVMAREQGEEDTVVDFIDEILKDYIGYVKKYEGLIRDNDLSMARILAKNSMLNAMKEVPNE